jgi:hypothetical protein
MLLLTLSNVFNPPVCSVPFSVILTMLKSSASIPFTPLLPEVEVMDLSAKKNGVLWTPFLKKIINLFFTSPASFS